MSESSGSPSIGPLASLGSSGTPAQRSADETETRELQGDAVGPPEQETRVGGTVSRYVVLEEVGRGGMGLVVRAYDPKLQREVALKEVHAHQLDNEASTRLVAEARAMAKLSHPNVVAVYDVEVLERSIDPPLASLGSSGKVILVMEYVSGQTLRAWLRQKKRPWRDIIDRFLAAGQGLVAAHEAGLLHRDFKPANVLCSTNAGADRSSVKVTDFGLAKADASVASTGDIVDRAPAEAESLTHVGSVMGTPRYMAPEQHEGGELNAAADQYAFCVALWEALCGQPPFAGKTMLLDKASGPPPWRDSLTPQPIVDAIVRGLSPSPDDRWPTVAALLEALAYDPTRRRNRWLLGLGTVGVLGLAGVSYEAWGEARAKRCSGAEQQLTGIWDPTTSAEVKAALLGIGKSYAHDVWARTQRELDAYASDWAAMHTEACEATTVRGEQSPQMMDLRMGCLHRAAQELQATVETLTDADAEVVHNAHELTGGLRPLSRCADTDALAAQVEPPLPAEADAVEAARLELARADSLNRAGRYGAALTVVEDAKDALAAVEYGPVLTEVALLEGGVLNELGQYEASEAALSEALKLGSQWRQWDAMASAASQLMYVVGYRQLRMEEGLRYWPPAQGLSRGQPTQEAAARNNLGIILKAQGKYAEAEAELRAALSLREKAQGPHHPAVAASRNNLAAVVNARGKYEEAESEYRAALSLRKKALGPDHPEVAASRNNLAAVLNARGKHEEAEAEYRAALSLRERALGPDHPDVAVSRNNLATMLHARGKYADAEAEFRAALSMWEKALGPDHPDVATSRNNLASVLQAQGKYEEAEAEQRAALSMWEEALGPDHPEVVPPRNNLAAVLHAQGKHGEAEAEYRAVLSLRKRALGPDHPDVAASQSNLGTVLKARGKYAEAEAEHRAALSLRTRVLGPDHPDVATSRNNLATALSAQGKYEEAEAGYRAALSMWEKALGPDHPDVARSRHNLASVLLRLGRIAEALPLAEKAWDRRQRDDIPTGHRAKAALLLAKILWTVMGPARDRSRARQLAEDALRLYRDAGEPREERVREVQQWLDAHELPSP